MAMDFCRKGQVCLTMKRKSQLINSQINVGLKKDFDLAEALESVYPLLEIVFSYLDYDDLQRVSEVKTSWKDTAHRVLQKRNEVSWITVFRKERKTVVYHSFNYPYTNMALGIIFFNFNQVSLNDSFCWHDMGNRKKITFADFLSLRIVPSGMNYCVIGCHGLASMFFKQTNKKLISFFDCCFLPTIPNMRMSMFYYDYKHLRNDYIKANERVKCILLFCKHDLDHNIFPLLDNILNQQDFKQVALGGGVVRKKMIYPLQDKGRKPNNLCILLTEDISFDSICDTSSIVIIGNNLTSKNFEEQLSKFKKKIVIRSQRIALKICCASKTKKNCELEIFNKVFPNTPLLGIEVGGEIGWDCFNKQELSEELNQSKPKKAKRFPTVQHQWSTVIVFITWGEKVYESSADNI